MALPVTTQIHIGDTEITEFTGLSISQSLFGHHQFSLSIPYDRLEGTTGTFLSKAHEELCGQKITISFGQLQAATGEGKPSNKPFAFAFQGIVTQLEVGNQSDLTGAFQVQGYSPTYFLDDAPVRHTYRQQSLQAVFERVLQPYSGDLLPLQAKPSNTAPITYLAQYDESNFSFLHRLAAQYGEWFYYDGTRLQLGKPAAKEIPFESDGVRSSFNLNISLRHSAFVVSQYHLAQHQTLKATSEAQSVSWLGQNPLTEFALSQSERLFPTAMQLPPTTAIASQADVDKVAARYKSQHATSLVSCAGWGENPDMQLGNVLNVTGEGMGSNAAGQASFGKYLITSIVHTVDESGLYSNLFDAVPWSAEHPPLSPHRKPPVGQPELAEVVDLADPQHLGRVRVRYFWPVASPADAETDWLRVSTPYSGDGKGQLFTPELHSQVLVGYEHNWAEQPLILGNLFHPQNPQNAKYTTDQNHLKGLQTAGGNKFVMSDTKGEQTILMSNSNNKGTAIEVGFKGDGSISIKSNGPISLTAGGNITLTATKDIILTAENVTINAKQKLAKTAKTVEMTGTDSVDITGKTTALNAGETMTIAATSSLDVTGGHTASISSGKTRIH